KFKVRKRESQRKLTQTDQNLVRLQDIIGEQKRQLDSLQRQAQRAERYRNLKNEIKNKEMWVASQTYLSMHEEMNEAHRQFVEAQDCDTSVTTEISQMESDLAIMKVEVIEREQRVESIQSERQKIQEQSQLLENEIRELRFEMEQARRNKEMTGNILEQYEARQKALENEKLSYEERVNSLAQISEDLEQKYSLRNEEYQKIQKRVAEVEEELTVRRREMLTVSQTESHIGAKLLSVQTQIEEVQSNLESSREVLTELLSKNEEFEARRLQVQQTLEDERQLQTAILHEVEKFQKDLSTAKDECEIKRTEVDANKDALNEVASRLYGLENLRANFEGFEEGVKSVMLWQRQKIEASSTQEDSASAKEIPFQPMAEIVEVPEQYELAMEAALGSRLQMLLSQNSEQALLAVDFLKDQKTGRSSFVALDKEVGAGVQESRASEMEAGLSSESGFHAFIRDLVVVPEP
ncbi:MAG: chromosome segregation protein SMC, partial [Bdellovibrionales bacterium]|nr:chromosome segregation protein SMC [Bdellovibrionales bacterium]